MKALGANLKENEKPIKICTHVYSTGSLGQAIKEQSLVLETGKGLVIITGCAHPGIVNIIQTAKDSFKQNVYLVLGGFHLGGSPESELKKTINQFRELRVEKAGPCHCSGDQCRKLFADEYEENLVNIGVGKTIKIE